MNLRSLPQKFDCQEVIDAGGIPKSELLDGHEYEGHHRIATKAIWRAERNKFEYLRQKFKFEYSDYCNHFEDDDGYSLFVPIKLIDNYSH